jgi:hypothetical protein
VFVYTGAVRKPCWLLAVLIFACADTGLSQEATLKYLGYASCQSSSCHGGSERGEVITWKEKDFHSRAFVILTTARSARMAETLHLGDATKSARCTVCHSPFQTLPAETLAATAHSNEGVSCESCHGAADTWIRAHTRPDFTYKNRLAVGMRDLRGLYARANACVSCHENIEPAILAAGHPELIFELASQIVSEPPHWREEGEWLNIREWLEGQAVALREASWRLTKASDARSLSRWKALSWLLHEVGAEIPDLPRIPTPAAKPEIADFSKIQQLSDRIARMAEGIVWSTAQSNKMLEKLAGLDTDFTASGDTGDQARRAEVLAQALDRLAVSLPAADRPKADAFRALDHLFEDVRHPLDFQAAQFAEHLREFRQLAVKH